MYITIKDIQYLERLGIIITFKDKFSGYEIEDYIKDNPTKGPDDYINIKRLHFEELTNDKKNEVIETAINHLSGLFYICYAFAKAFDANNKSFDNNPILIEDVVKQIFPEFYEFIMIKGQYYKERYDIECLTETSIKYEWTSPWHDVLYDEKYLEISNLLKSIQNG